MRSSPQLILGQCLVAMLALVGCAATTETGARRDAGHSLDGGHAQVDAGPAFDGGPRDATLGDTGAPPVNDMSFADGGTPDMGAVDAGLPDLGPPDLGPPDLGPPDLGAPDLGLCAYVYANPTAASDSDVWNCGLVAGQLGGCIANDATSCGTCGCDAYVTAASICTGGSCTAPISGTGCSSASYYAGAPFYCSGAIIPQSACMLRYLILNGYCD